MDMKGNNWTGKEMKGKEIKGNERKWKEMEENDTVTANSKETLEFLNVLSVLPTS